MPKHKYPERKSKYTKEILEPIVQSSFSYREVMRKLGLGDDGGHKKLREQISLCDTSHFQGQSWSRGRNLPRKTNEQFFVKGSLTSSWSIRNALFSRGIKEKKCESCDGIEWCGKPIPLEVHHKNGDSTDNRLENLEILCPNCHYFTDTYKTKNRKPVYSNGKEG